MTTVCTLSPEIIRIEFACIAAAKGYFPNANAALDGVFALVGVAGVTVCLWGESLLVPSEMFDLSLDDVSSFMSGRFQWGNLPTPPEYPLSEKEYRKKHPEKLRIYDIASDNFRDATQKDIDDYGALGRAYGHLRTAMKDAHEKLMDSVNPVKRP